MKVTIAAVISVDGKLTKHDDPDLHSWVSDEDQAHFKSLIDATDVIVIGRNIYELSKAKGTIAGEAGKLRVVLTSTPENFVDDEVEGQLIFRKDTPQELVDYLESQASQNVLVAGGERMITEFLEAKCVDELYITVEPRIFGEGVMLTGPMQLDDRKNLAEAISGFANSEGGIVWHTIRQHFE